MAANLYYTPSTYSSSTTGTFSFWIKRGKLSSEGNTVIWSNTSTNDNNRTYFSINSDDKIRVSVQYSGSDDDNVTNAKFRDTFGWMHIVIRLDSTQGTAANRCVIWVNGEQQSMSSNAGTPSGNITAFQTSLSNSHFWGGIYGSASGLDNAYLTQCVYCDGQAYSASNFGETDSTTGEWKPKTDLSGLTFGNNGYWLKFENSANMGLDSSGNSNNLTNNSNEVLQVADNPSNVFATLNPLFIGNGQASTFSNGNTTGQSPTSQGIGGTSTLAANSGKFYAEFKYAADTSGSNNEGAIGVCDTYFLSSNSNLGGSSSPGYQEYSVANWGLRNSGNTFYSSNGSKYTNTSQHGNWTLNDIIGVALDIDNNRVYFSKNGGWWDGTSSWGGASPTNYITLDSTGFEGNYHFAVGDSSSGNSVTWNSNFGNGYFGTTAVSSAGTNASGIGIFEYDVPTGYTALSTKGLNL